MITKTEQVKELLKQGNTHKALRIAKDFKKTFGITSQELKDLKLGWECLQYPEMYEQLGRDVDYQIKIAISILNKVYGGND